MTSWRSKVFWSAFVLLYAAYALRMGYELLKPVIPALITLAVLIAIIWFFVMRQRRW